MPMASTIANSVSVLIEKPSAYSPANVPISDTGTAIIGIRVARQCCRNTNTTSSTSTAASKIVFTTSWIDASITTRGVERDEVVHAGGERGLELAPAALLIAAATSSALAPVCRKTAMPTAGWPSTVVVMS